MKNEFQFKELPEEQRVAFYGALFALSASDGAMDRTELSLIFESLDLENMSEANQKRVRKFLVDPPSIASCLKQLSKASDELRFALMIQLVEVALADEVIAPEEEETLQTAQKALRISNNQRDAIENFVREANRVRQRGRNDYRASEIMKGAASMLSETGVPSSSLFFSSSAIELGAAGISSGLAALGLGLGIIPGISMIPGVGISILVALSVYSTTKWFFSKAKRKKEAKLEQERYERTKFMINNLEDTIFEIGKRVNSLKRQEELSPEDEKAIKTLTQRLDALTDLVSWRRSSLPPPPAVPLG